MNAFLIALHFLTRIAIKREIHFLIIMLLKHQQLIVNFSTTSKSLTELPFICHF